MWGKERGGGGSVVYVFSVCVCVCVCVSLSSFFLPSLCVLLSESLSFSGSSFWLSSWCPSQVAELARLVDPESL